MNKQTDALKLALEALSPWAGEDANHTEQYAAYHAIREALAQPEQKPVAWQVMVEDEAMKEFRIKDMAHDWCVHQKLSGSSYAYWIRPLYTTPPQRKPLTDEEIYKIANDLFYGNGPCDTLAMCRAIEAAHGITGEQHG